MEITKVRKLAIKALLSKEFPQLSLFDPEGFDSHANKRGLSLFPSRIKLQEWDRLGIFHPIIKARRPVVYHRVIRDHNGQPISYEPEPVDPAEYSGEDIVPYYEGYTYGQEQIRYWREHEHALIIQPSVETYETWKEHGDEILYHPYQIFRLKTIMGLSKLTLSFDVNWWENSSSFYKSHVESALKNIRNTEVEYLQELSLLFLIEDKYLPEVTGQIHFFGFMKEQYNEWYEWSKYLDLKKILEQTGLNQEAVEKMRENYAIEGRMADPIPDWYVLIRHVPYDRRRVEGVAQLAWDYYDVSEILGLFLRDLTGKRQHHTDDLMSGLEGKWKKGMYGFEPEQIDYHRANALPNILRRFGLDPRSKVLLVVEGLSEEEFCKAWFAKRNVYISGRIRIHIIGTTQQVASPRTIQILKHALEDRMCIIVTVDDENNAEEQLEQLKQQKLIAKIYPPGDLKNPNFNPIGGLLWQPCFEDANFTFEELFEAWKSLLYLEKGDTISEERIKQAVEKSSEYAYKGPLKQMVRVGQKYRGIDNSTFAYNKLDVARQLANTFYASEKPIILLLEKIVQLAGYARTSIYEPEE